MNVIAAFFVQPFSLLSSGKGALCLFQYGRRLYVGIRNLRIFDFNSKIDPMKYVSVDSDQIKVEVERHKNFETLELNIFLPE